MLLDHILQAGPVAVILLGLSAVAFAILLERLWLQLSYPLFSQHSLATCKRLLQEQDFDALTLNVTGRRGWRTGVATLVKNRHLDNEQRQQLAMAWLVGEQRLFNARLKLLALIGSLAPLLGLLGTVFGIIAMFKAIAHNTGPVTPALLAEGMWEAMVTTALGLVIAIPALAASHGLEQLSQRRLQGIQDALNELNMLLQGQSSSVASEATESTNTAAEVQSATHRNIEGDGALQPIAAVGIA